MRRGVLPGLGAREREDFATLAAASLLVPATWLALGWRWRDSVSGYDGLANVLVLFARLADARGDWSQLLYRPELLGGMELRDAVGPLPVAGLLARLGFSAGAVLDLTTFLVQVALAFLGLRLGTDLAARWAAPAPPRLTWPLRAAGIWACAFAPVLGWKIGYGHLTMVMGGLPFLAVAAVLAAASAGRLGAVLLLVAASAFVNGLLFTGHQIVLYGVVFGGPILAGLWPWRGGGSHRALALAALAGAGACLIVVPRFWGVLMHALGTDSLRTLGGMNLTYSYLTAYPRDWLGSLLWTRQAIPPWRPELLHHEVNNPLGPSLLLLAFVPWRKARPLALGVLASLWLALVFSMDARPFSTWLLWLVPPLGSFRVPTRAIMPALLVLPAIGLASAAWRQEAETTREGGRSRILLSSLGLGAVLCLLPSIPREIAAWMLGVTAILALRPTGWLARAPALGRTLRPACLLLVLAMGGVAAFHERLLPFIDADALLARAGSIGAKARADDPKLARPLARVWPAFEWPELSANTAVAAGLSSLDGYYFPQRRFVELVNALRGQPYRPNSLLLRFPPTHPSSYPLYQLYDVRSIVNEDGSVRTLVPTAGPAWFSAAFETSASYGDLASALLSQGRDLARVTHRKAWILPNDPLVLSASLPASLNPGCAEARVLGVDSGHSGFLLKAKVRTAAACPLTFATNYAETLRATLFLVNGRPVPAAVFPVYGALAGVWVAPGTTEVRLAVEPREIPLAGLWSGLGLVLLIGAAVAAALDGRSTHGA